MNEETTEAFFKYTESLQKNMVEFYNSCMNQGVAPNDIKIAMVFGLTSELVGFIEGVSDVELYDLHNKEIERLRVLVNGKKV